MNKVDKKFLDKAAYYSPSMVLFSREVILEIIEYCKKEDIGILGIDALYIWKIVYEDKIRIGIQGSLSYNLEFQPDSYENYIAGVKSIQDKRPFFEIIINEDETIKNYESLTPLSFKKVLNHQWIPSPEIKFPYLPDDFFEYSEDYYVYVNIDY